MNRTAQRRSETRGQIQSPRLWHRVKVDSGIGLPMVSMSESTLDWTSGEVIVNSCIGSYVSVYVGFSPRF
jgi:hypothetical protein